MQGKSLCDEILAHLKKTLNHSRIFPVFQLNQAYTLSALQERNFRWIRHESI